MPRLHRRYYCCRATKACLNKKCALGLGRSMGISFCEASPHHQIDFCISLWPRPQTQVLFLVRNRALYASSKPFSLFGSASIIRIWQTIAIFVLTDLPCSSRLVGDKRACVRVVWGVVQLARRREKCLIFLPSFAHLGSRSTPRAMSYHDHLMPCQLRPRRHSHACLEPDPEGPFESNQITPVIRA